MSQFQVYYRVHKDIQWNSCVKNHTCPDKKGKIVILASIAHTEQGQSDIKTINQLESSENVNDKNK